MLAWMLLMMFAASGAMGIGRKKIRRRKEQEKQAEKQAEEQAEKQAEKQEKYAGKRGKNY